MVGSKNIFRFSTTLKFNFEGLTQKDPTQISGWSFFSGSSLLRPLWILLFREAFQKKLDILWQPVMFFKKYWIIHGFDFLTSDSGTNPLVIISFGKEIMFYVCYLPTLWQVVIKYPGFFGRLPLVVLKYTVYLKIGSVLLLCKLNTQCSAD